MLIVERQRNAVIGKEIDDGSTGRSDTDGFGSKTMSGTLAKVHG